MTRTFASLLLCCAILTTAACESSEERAEEHFQEGVALLEAGDVDRALVEFRNVFRLDGTHKEARRLYAQTEIGRGNVNAGYGQYLRLIEQYPDDADARRELTRLAMERGDWEEVGKHAPHVIEANAADVMGRIADIGLRYREALEAEDASARAEVVEDALALREETAPESSLISELLADHYVREGRREEALDEIALAIENGGDQQRLYAMRLALLQEMGDFDAVESTLQEMVELFPDQPPVQATLLRWYLSQDKLDEAEAFLRERAASGESAENIDLVRFLVEYRSREAGLAELDTLIAAGTEDTPLYRSVRAGLAFEAGRREEAIAELQSLVDAADQDSDQNRNVKIALAQMLQQTGNSVGARALVEDVLAADPNHTEALKMRAASLIDADATDEAILALRTALQQSPRDPSLMIALAQAYERAGNRPLMAEMLSLAVEVSNSAPAETVLYARYLVSQGNTAVAERALVDSLRLNPGNPEVLQTLGSIYVEQADWARAEQVAESLASVDMPAAQTAANALRARVLAAQGRNEEVVGFLQQLVDSGEAGSDAQVAIVRTHLQNGNTDAAMQYLDSRLADDPDQPTLRFLKGAVLEVIGRQDEAEAIYSELTEENPGATMVWRALYLLQQRQGEAQAADATLEAALAANPETADLLWIKASELQRAGDLEAALEIYSGMYERDSSAPIIANNYASLLTTLRDDEESIARAYNIARRLQGIEVPAFQDTFGWIAHLRGEHELAIEHLEPAAEALSEDPSVQYHLAMAYSAVGRNDEAKEALQRAIDLVDQGARLPEIEQARQRLAELR